MKKLSANEMRKVEGGKTYTLECGNTANSKIGCWFHKLFCVLCTSAVQQGRAYYW